MRLSRVEFLLNEGVDVGVTFAKLMLVDVLISTFDHWEQTLLPKRQESTDFRSSVHFRLNRERDGNAISIEENFSDACRDETTADNVLSIGSTSSD